MSPANEYCIRLLTTRKIVKMFPENYLTAVLLKAICQIVDVDVEDVNDLLSKEIRYS
jgi:hypothetical protein